MNRTIADRPSEPESGWAVFKTTVGNEIGLYRAVFTDLFGELWYATTDGVVLVVSCVRPWVETHGTAVYVSVTTAVGSVFDSGEFNLLSVVAMSSLVFTQFWIIPVVALGEFGSRKLWVVVKDGGAVVWDFSTQLPQAIYTKAADGTSWVIEKTLAVASITQGLAIGTLIVVGSMYVFSETYVKRRRIT
jgi:uncharacterized membrane protein YgdD (TMEM256/DUF423 family)